MSSCAIPMLGAAAASGVGAAVAIRRERPRFPVVFYSIQDDDTYFREFRASGILSHYAYVRKSNYLLPSMLAPLLADAIAGRSFIDPEIEDRVDEVREQRRDLAARAAGAERAAGRRIAGAGADQRADRRAPGPARRPRRQPDERAHLRRLAAEREHHRREGGPRPRRAHLRL